MWGIFLENLCRFQNVRGQRTSITGASFSNSFWSLFVFNVFFIGLSMTLCFASCYNALFYFYSDDQLYLFSSAVLAGTGIGVLPECLIFALFLETLGWKKVYLVQLTFLIALIITSIILSPYFMKLLSIKSSVEKGREPDAETEQKAPFLNERSYTSSSRVSSSCDSLFPSRNFIASQDLGPFPNMSMTIQKTTEQSLMGLFRGLFLNGPFVCVLLSFATGSSGFDGLMTHHPIRLLQRGIGSGPLSLALNGCLQVFIRILVGITATRGLVTPIRMSQLAKLSLAVSTVLSNVFTGPKYQLFYYFFIGIGGGVINVADFLLIRDCVSSGRDLAASFFCLTNGISNLPVIIVMGILYQQTGSYAVSYNFVSALFAISISLAILYELLMKKCRHYVIL